MGTKTVTDDSFSTDVLGADGPVLVDFWAEWCGPCRMIAPALEEISKELGEKVTIAKLNIDENPDTPSRYGVRGIPTMLLFKGGQPIAQKVGAAPRRTCGRPTATRFTPAPASAPLASAVRVQAPTSDERSEPCRRRRRGAESVRHGGRSAQAPATLAAIEQSGDAAVWASPG